MSPTLERLNDRMNKRAVQRRVSGDPLAELSASLAAGDYSYRGITDWKTIPNRSWVPGVSAKDVPAGHVTYLGTNTPAVERYFTAYNRALLPRRAGMKLDNYGFVIK